MTRKNIEEVTTIKDPVRWLSENIYEYGLMQEKLKSAKADSDDLNKQIKQVMKQQELSEFEVEGWRATYSIQDRSSLNEEKLIEFLKKNKLAKGIVRRKEYVDSNALENAIYNGIIPEDLVLEMDSCQEHKEVEVLKVSRKKG